MGQCLAGAAGSGSTSEYALSAEQRRLLTQGDIEGLLELHGSTFGFAVMEEEDDEDENDDEDTEDDEDSEDDANSDEDDEDDEDEDSEDRDKKSKGKKGKKTDPKDDKIRELSAEAKKYRLKNRTFRNQIADLQRQIADLTKGKSKKPKGKDDEDGSDAQPDPEITRKLEQSQRTNEDLLIRLEFMADKTYSWKDPKAALKLLDASDIEIDDDGDIDGLEDAIKQLAEDYPFLLDKSKEERDESKRRRRGATGQSTGGKRKNGSSASREKLLQKYPALRR
jgi:hypothetical protein